MLMPRSVRRRAHAGEVARIESTWPRASERTRSPQNGSGAPGVCKRGSPSWVSNEVLSVDISVGGRGDAEADLGQSQPANAARLSAVA